MKKKIVFIFQIAAFGMILGLLMLSNNAKAEILTGEMSPMSWSFDTQTCVLTISGNGEIDEDLLQEFGADNTEVRKQVEEIIISEGARSIPAWFLNHTPNVQSISIPATVESIDEDAFGNNKLVSINVDEQNQYYCSMDGVLFNKNKTKVIQYPSGLNADYYAIPEGVTSIGNGAFESCLLKNIGIPNSLAGIGDHAFCECSCLESIDLPNGLTSIGENAFLDCNELTTISIPGSVTSIGDNAFCLCSGLRSINVVENNNYYCSEDGVLFDKDKKILIRYPEGKVGETYEIPGSVTSIADFAISWCDKLTNVYIPNGVVSIGKYAFCSCENITSFVIPDSVETIGESAFSSCSSMKSIKLSSNLTSIESALFFSCRSLTSIVIPESVTSIGNTAFKRCFKLTSIDIPESVTEIGWVAFYDCVDLVDVTLPEHLTSVQERTFFGCSSLTTITIPEGVTSIERWAFADCINLERVIIPGTVTTMDDSAFDYSGENLTIYCRANSYAQQYAEGHPDISCITDDIPPVISNLKQEEPYIYATAADDEDGVGLAMKAYSLDGANWQASNRFEVSASGKYTVYARDLLGNIASGTIDVTIAKKDGTNDDTQSKTFIPNTGETYPFVALGAIIVFAIIRRKNLK